MTLFAVPEIARQTFLQLLKSRLLWLLLPGQLLAMALPWAIVASDDRPPSGHEAYCVLAFWLYVFVAAPWTALFFGVQAVHGDVEDRTFQYLFLRPVPRWALLLGKWLAAAGLTALLVAAGQALLFAIIALLPFEWPSGAPDLRLVPVLAGVGAVAAVAYASVATLFGAWFRRPMVWGVVFIVGLEFIVANLPAEAGVRSLTVADPVRRLLFAWLDPPRRLAAALWPAQEGLDPDTLGNPQGNIALLVSVCLLLALWRYSATEYDSRTRD